MTEINAKIVADSINKQGDRITSFLLNMPRLSLSEYNTHRLFSRNSASSRAIPFKRMIEMVENTPFIPIKFQKDHSGMQGTEYFTEQKDIDELTSLWLIGRDYAVTAAKDLNKYGLTKQMCNRLLEPFAWHKVLCTATNYENFFALRAEDQAEIHIQELAYKMLEEYNNSIPNYLEEGKWHIPYGNEIDENKLTELFSEEDKELAKIKIAIARCARTSYTTIDTELKHDYASDIKLCDRLTRSKHWSPFEHIAQTMSDEQYNVFRKTEMKNGKIVTENGWCKNFKGFIQFRCFFEYENQKDSRVKK